MIGQLESTAPRRWDGPVGNSNRKRRPDAEMETVSVGHLSCCCKAITGR